SVPARLFGTPWTTSPTLRTASDTSSASPILAPRPLPACTAVPGAVTAGRCCEPSRARSSVEVWRPVPVSVSAGLRASAGTRVGPDSPTCPPPPPIRGRAGPILTSRRERRLPDGYALALVIGEPGAHHPRACDLITANRRKLSCASDVDGKRSAYCSS